MKILRNQYLILIFGTFYFFFSCTQYEIRNRSFDYALAKSFSLEDIVLYNSLSEKSSVILNNEDLLNDINSHYGTNLILPESVYYAFDNIENVEELKTHLINQKLLTQKDYDNIVKFSEDTELQNLENGLVNFEKNVLSQNLNDIQFNQYQLFANSMKITSEIEPAFFEKDSLLMSKGPWMCALAYFLFFWALIGLIGGCATIMFCIAAWFGFVAAAANVIVECGANME